MVFKFYCIYNGSKSTYFVSSCLLQWKHLLIKDILPEAKSNPPPPPTNETSGNSKGIVSLNSAF